MSVRRRSMVRAFGLMALGVLVLLAAGLALAGCGGGSSENSSTTAAGAGETKTYKDSTYGYSFEYPASWQIEQQTSVDVTAGGSSAGAVGVFNPQGAKAGETYIDLMLVSVYKLNKTIDDSNFGQIKGEIDQVLNSLESQGTDMKREKALTETTAAGMRGYTVTYSFTKDEVPCMSTLYFLFNGTTEYQLTTQASADNWPADQAIFDAMIASFKPGPAESTPSSESPPSS